MVRPSRSMQPEHVDLLQAGRNTGMGADGSFHNYMALKIAKQREQFGMVLPPPPPLPPPEKMKDSVLNRRTAIRFMQPAPVIIEEASENTATDLISSFQGSDIKNRTNGTTSRTVRFVEGVKTTEKSRPKKKRTKMESIIRRLKKRHGRGDKSLERKKRIRTKQNEQNENNDTNPPPMEEDSISELARMFSMADDNDSFNYEIENTEHRSEQQGTQKISTMNSPITEERTPTKMIDTPTSLKSLRKSRPDLFFYGVVVKVNGYTHPDTETIKRLLQKHGGDFETYETERVTHIIAEQLSMAKANAYKRQKRPRPVCRPAWIVDSVNEGKLLPCGKYLLVENDDQRQMGIQSMFQKQKLLQLDTNTSSPEKVGVVRNNDQHQQKHYNSPYSSIEVPRQSPIRLDHNIDIEKELLNQPDKNDNTDNKYIDGKIRTIGTDPKFLDSYFSSSRLSFIGSFKQRTSSKSHSYSSNSTRLIFHVDMDCFFASVSLRKYPQYRDKPVVISHHGKRSNVNEQNDNDRDNAAFDLSHDRAINIPKNSSSECATCNYVARKYGIKKGMFLGRAKELCPELIVLSYDFKGYEEVSQQVLDILDRLINSENHRGNIEVVSCDEAYVDLYFDDPNVLENIYDHAFQLAESVRNQIFETTQCTASIGIGCNKFLAKLGTDKVKPNRSYCVKDFEELLKDLNLRDLHGIGRRTDIKLSEEGLVTVQDVWNLGSKGENELIRILGPGNGKKIYDFTRGKDDRPITPVERKTIGAECNYGVRFDGPFGIDHFMEGLAKEVEKRMKGISVKGKRLTLKIKQRKKGAKEALKFLGHGSCDSLSKSRGVPGNGVTRDAEIFKKVGLSILKEFAIGDINDIRGMGITISSLENDNATEKQMIATTGMQHWLQTNIHPGKDDDNIRSNKYSETSEKSMYRSPVVNGILLSEQQSNDKKDKMDIEQGVLKESLFRDDESPLIELPPMSQIHMSQVEALPQELQQQIASRMKKAGAGNIEESININDEYNNHLVDSEINSANRFRQTDLKRMMKLAAVKSGHDRTGISLTQLDELPLEIKLQVVNEDNRQLGVLSPRSSRPKTSNDRRSRKSNSDVDHSHLKTKRINSGYTRNRNEMKDEGIQSINNNTSIHLEKDSNIVKNGDTLNSENNQITNREDSKEEMVDEMSAVRTLWKDTLEIFIHQILYRRKVYPTDTFCSTRYIGTQCKINRHPGVAAYIKEALQVIVPIFFDDDHDDCGERYSRQFGEELLVEIHDQTTMITFEQFSLSFPLGNNAFNVATSVLKRELRDMICSTGKLEGLQSYIWSDSISFRILLLVHPSDIPKLTEAGDNALGKTGWLRTNLITDHLIENRVVHHVPNSACRFQYRLIHKPDQNNGKP